MTEAEWLSCADPFAQFAHLGASAGWRKRQLYCLACWGRARHLLADDYSHKGLARLEAWTSFDWNDQDALHYEAAEEAIVDVDCELGNRFWNRLVAGDEELWDTFEAGAEARLTSWDDPLCVEAAAAFAVSAEALHSRWVWRL